MLKRSGLPFYTRVAVGTLMLLFGLHNSSSAQRNDAETQTTVTVRVPEAIDGGHLLFGVPLQGVKSPRHVAVYDESKNFVQADVFPLQNWQTQSKRWALIALPITSDSTKTRTLTIDWEKPLAPFEPGIQLNEMGSGELAIVNRHYDLRITSKGIASISTPTAEFEDIDWQPGLRLYQEEKLLTPDETGEIEILYNGNLYKKVRIVNQISGQVQMHQEFDFFAGSPYIKSQVRFINTSSEAVSLDGLVPLNIQFTGAQAKAVGLRDDIMIPTSHFSYHQGKHDWLLALSDTINVRGRDFELNEWAAIKLKNGVTVQWITPDFQELAADLIDRENVWEFKNDRLSMQYYRPLSDGAKDQVMLTKGMAKTFTHWMVFTGENESFASHAKKIHNMPYAIYDPSYLAKEGLMLEPRNMASIPLDINPLLTALQPVPAPLLSTATEKYEVGGMLYGIYPDIHETSSSLSGDVSLALIHGYLKWGDPMLRQIAYQHTLLQADWGVSHVIGTYDPIENPVAYPSFEGLLTGYLLWGDPWLLESAKQQAQNITGTPRNLGVSRGGDTQTRSLSSEANTRSWTLEQTLAANALNQMADILGESDLQETSKTMTSYLQSQQTSAGSWEYASQDISPSLLTGLVNQKLWHLYKQSQDENVKNSFLKGIEWSIYRQTSIDETYPGLFSAKEETKWDELAEWRLIYQATAQQADALNKAYQLTQNQDYFYAAHAGWYNVLTQGWLQQAQDNSNLMSAHLAIEGIPDFFEAAVRDELPMVIGNPDMLHDQALWMGPKATWDKKQFSFALKHTPAPVADAESNHTSTQEEKVLSIYFPAGEPQEVRVNEKVVDFTYNENLAIIECSIPLGTSDQTYQVVVALKGA